MPVVMGLFKPLVYFSGCWMETAAADFAGGFFPFEVFDKLPAFVHPARL
jgi:hypothetical protein